MSTPATLQQISKTWVVKYKEQQYFVSGTIASLDELQNLMSTTLVRCGVTLPAVFVIKMWKNGYGWVIPTQWKHVSQYEENIRLLIEPMP